MESTIDSILSDWRHLEWMRINLKSHQMEIEVKSEYCDCGKLFTYEGFEENGNYKYGFMVCEDCKIAYAFKKS